MFHWSSLLLFAVVSMRHMAGLRAQREGDRKRAQIASQTQRATSIITDISRVLAAAVVLPLLLCCCFCCCAAALYSNKGPTALLSVEIRRFRNSHERVGSACPPAG